MEDEVSKLAEGLMRHVDAAGSGLSLEDWISLLREVCSECEIRQEAAQVDIKNRD